MNLYEIDEGILGCVDMETGEVIDADRLAGLEMARDAKVENIGLWVKDLLSEAAAIKAEKEALAARQKAAEGKAASLKGYLERYLDGAKFKTPRLSISYRRSTAVEVDDISQLPEEYLRIVGPTPDKEALGKALKDGQEIPGAHLVERQGMQIR